jgi:hypothetical protein
LEVRSSLTHNRIARVLLCIHQGQIVLLHGFIKKTQQTPENDLDLAAKRQNEVDDEPVEFVEVLEPRGLFAAPDVGQPGKRQERIGSDNERAQKSLKLNDVGDSFGAAHEPVAGSFKVSKSSSENVVKAARAESGCFELRCHSLTSRYQIGNDALIDIEVTFVFTQIPNLVAFVQHTPDLRTEAECMRKHLKYDVALMWPKSFAPKSC